jgi:hypothetical protein
VTLLHPRFTAAKTCAAQPVGRSGPAKFNISFANTGDADLHVVPSEGAPFDVPAGQPFSYQVNVAGPFTATVPNTVTGTVTLNPRYGLGNTYPMSASDECTVKGLVKVVKTMSGSAALPPPGQGFTFQLRTGATQFDDGTTLEQIEASSSNGGNLAFATELTPGQHYQMCEVVMPGWNTNLNGGALFVPSSLVPPNLPNANVNNMTVCADFSVESGGIQTFTVDNAPPPGGRALTIGYWKNWASCAKSNGQGHKPMLDLALGLATAAAANPPGGVVVSAADGIWPNYAPAWFLVLKGDPASTRDSIKVAPDCAKAVNLLNKTTIDGKTKKASDPLFNMMAQLVAVQANRSIGAGVDGNTVINVDRAVKLAGAYGFNGLPYTKTLSAVDANLANCLATQLDNYNNDRAVGLCLP